MDLMDYAFLLMAGIAGGGANAIAGGGTFFTFPALIAVGLDPLTANTTNAVAIYPGHMAAIPAYRTELSQAGKTLLPRSVIAVCGGLCGALLLLWAGAKVFISLVPFLLLAATFLFAAAPAINRLARKAKLESKRLNGAVEFMFAVYGGYFGAGLGVLLMASLSIVGIRDIQAANAQKNLIATVITTISVAVFIGAGAVAWPQAICVLVGALIGGYAGARLARIIPARLLKSVVVAVGLFLSGYYFLTL